ncbi:MAG: DNA-processing protein DprA [Phycisphaerales bacterium]|nr:DNA-processing protein DprA [Phycisphaerales bacterium]
MPPSSQSQLNWLRLTAAEGVGPRTIRRLLQHFGNVDAIVAAADRGASVDWPPDMPGSACQALCAAIARSAPGDERERLRRIDGVHVAFNDDAFPPQMMNIPDPPALLRVAGQCSVLSAPSIAIVGTRRCSSVGLRQAGRFAAACADAGVVVVSGGARGIDAEAHRAALRAGGATIVVMGSGLGCPYPPEHAGLFDQVRQGGGALVSEYAMNRPPRPSQFPRRNRLISGLAQGVLVVEAPARSGAMLTARLAVEAHGRDCWAVPGDADRREARGGLEAIRDGWAACAIEPADVLADVMARLPPSATGESASKQALQCSLGKMEGKVLHALRRGGCGVAELVEAIDAVAGDILRAVTTLEMSGVLRRSGSRVSLTPAGLEVAAAARRRAC